MNALYSIYNIIFTYTKDGVEYMTSNPHLALKRKAQGFSVERYIVTDENTYHWSWKYTTVPYHLHIASSLDGTFSTSTLYMD